MANRNSLDRLLVQAAAGSRSVLPQLLEQCAAIMAARLRTRPHAEEAEDIVQEALLQACQRLDGFTWQGWDALQAWLWAFVENAHADRCKYHRRVCRDERRVIQDVSIPESDGSPAGVLAGVAGREESPSRHVRRQERDEHLRQAMHAVLTADQRRAIELRYFKFLSVKEVACQMGWTESKVKMLCDRAYDRLREVLNESMRSSGAS